MGEPIIHESELFLPLAPTLGAGTPEGRWPKMDIKNIEGDLGEPIVHESDLFLTLGPTFVPGTKMGTEPKLVSNFINFDGEWSRIEQFDLKTVPKSCLEKYIYSVYMHFFQTSDF